MVAVGSSGWVHAAPPRLFGSDIALVRYGRDGGLDPDFGSAGKVVTNLAGASSASAAALQPDGRIVVAGTAGPSPLDDPALVPYRFLLARYLPDGTLDVTFGADGMVEIASPDGGIEAAAVAVQADGRSWRPEQRRRRALTGAHSPSSRSRAI
jgi:uncharacterized delta-60 repeat protein